jgi:carboxyl-terminal processing protease
MRAVSASAETRVSRILICVSALSLSACAVSPTAARSAPARCTAETAALLDLEAAREAVQEHMPYPLGGGATLEDAFRPLRTQAEAARTPAENLRVLESFVFALADHHVGLDANSASSPRLVPTGSSVWADHRDGNWVVTQVRLGSAARRAGLREGMRITHVNGVTADELVLPPHVTGRSSAAAGFALRVALAGTHDRDAVIVAEGQQGRIEARLGLVEQTPGALASLSFPSSGTALIRIHNSLGDGDLPVQFAALMSRARKARVILLDLRDTPSGGDSSIAKPIMSWFVQGERGYQRHRRGDREWVETVRGRRDRFEGRLIVLVDHWTGSMGEGLAIGLRSAAGATLVGTSMAGLRGAIEPFPLPCLAGVSIRIPVEQLFTMEGQPRESVTPDVIVSGSDLAAAGESDAILAIAMRQASFLR